MRRKVVLYNPRTVFWTMPLALIAVGSALDRSRYEVVLIDARIEPDPIGALLRELDEKTVCLGITVLTGAPIRDALYVSRAVKIRSPETAIVWGGWHPSLFPEQCLAEPAVDAVVMGQGEATFAEMVERLAAHETLAGVPGCGYRATDHGMAMNMLRTFHDVNEFPAHNYALAAVEKYYEGKGKAQFDYIASQGCRFRCSFCADPTVYKRGWYGLAPERVAAELLAHKKAHHFEEISFQDETFFTSPGRVQAIAEAFLRCGLEVSWTATMRSDQGSRMDDRVLEICRRAGLKRVMMGVESGSPETLRRIQKDISIDQVFDAAEKCARQGIGAILNFIVGFPGESDESIRQTLDVAARLRALSPDFEASFFYYQPYPGTPLASELQAGGFRFSDTLEGWADFDYIGGKGEWISSERRLRIERFKFYQRFAFGADRRLSRAVLRPISRWRIRRGMFFFPVEKVIVEALRPPQTRS